MRTKTLILAVAMMATGATMATDIPAGALDIERVPRMNLISKEYGYVKAGWAVKVRNRTRDAYKGLWVKVKWLDAKGVELHQALEQVDDLPAFKTVNVTDTLMVKEDVWNRIKSVEVSVD